RDRLGRILAVLKDSLDPQHMLDNCMEKRRFQLYQGMAEAALNVGETRIIQLSSAELEDAEVIVFKTSGERKSQAIQDSVFYRAFLGYSQNVIEKMLSILLADKP